MSFVLSVIGFLGFGFACICAFLWETPHESMAMIFLGVTATLAINVLFHIEKGSVGISTL